MIGLNITRKLVLETRRSAPCELKFNYACQQDFQRRSSHWDHTNSSYPRVAVKSIVALISSNFPKESESVRMILRSLWKTGLRTLVWPLAVIKEKDHESLPNSLFMIADDCSLWVLLVVLYKFVKGSIDSFSLIHPRK